MPNNIDLYLSDIKIAIRKIQKFTRGISFENFSADEKTIDAVIRNFEIIGEASKNIPTEFKNKHKKIPWQKMIGLRNKMIHEYSGVDLEILWKTVEEDLPGLKKSLAMLKS